jgi:hypothetical protein
MGRHSDAGDPAKRTVSERLAELGVIGVAQRSLA